MCEAKSQEKCFFKTTSRLIFTTTKLRQTGVRGCRGYVFGTTRGKKGYVGGGRVKKSLVIS